MSFDGGIPDAISRLPSRANKPLSSNDCRRRSTMNRPRQASGYQPTRPPIQRPAANLTIAAGTVQADGLRVCVEGNSKQASEPLCVQRFMLLDQVLPARHLALSIIERQSKWSNKMGIGQRLYSTGPPRMPMTLKQSTASTARTPFSSTRSQESA